MITGADKITGDNKFLLEGSRAMFPKETFWIFFIPEVPFMGLLSNFRKKVVTGMDTRLDSRRFGARAHRNDNTCIKIMGWKEQGFIAVVFKF